MIFVAVVVAGFVGTAFWGFSWHCLSWFSLVLQAGIFLGAVVGGFVGALGGHFS